MKRKNRITVTLSDENMAHMLEAVEKTKITKTEFINRACSDAVIFCIEDGPLLANEFMKLRIAMEENQELDWDVRKEGERACQLLNSLMQKIDSFRN